MLHVRFEPMAGRKFGMLTAVRFLGKDNTRKSRWECVCECGKTIRARSDKLKEGRTISCGCLEKIGLARYVADRLMHSRRDLLRKKLRAVWHVTVCGSRCPRCPRKRCARWNQFENFIEDMKPTFFEGAALCRRVPRLGFSPRNCYWGTLSECRSINHLAYWRARRSSPQPDDTPL